MVYTTVPPKDTSSFLKALSVIFPLNELAHLKRVRKTADGTLEVIVCEKDDVATVRATIEKAAEAQTIALGEFGLVDVSKYPAVNPAQFAAWNPLWPMTYHDPQVSREDAEMDEQRIAQMKANLRRAMQLVDDQKVRMPPLVSLYFSCSLYMQALAGAVIVDPATDRVVCEAWDTREAHPLHHATMNLMDELARRLSDPAPAPAAASSSSQSSPPPTEEAPPVSGKRKDREDEASNSTDDISTGNTNSNAYICTGLDVYLSREPCVMCAMALVHSRARKVIYNPSQPVPFGGLGTAFSLHNEPRLNHHYDVYVCSDDDL